MSSSYPRMYHDGAIAGLVLRAVFGCPSSVNFEMRGCREDLGLARATTIES